MGLLSGSEGLKVCSKLPNIRLFGQLRAFPLQNCFEYILCYKFMETFPRIWSLRCTYFLVCWLLSGSEGPKIAQNYRMYDFWALKSIFISKHLVWIQFLEVQNHGDIMRIWALGCTYLLSIWGFWVGKRGRQLLKMTYYTTFGNFKSIFTSKT